MRPLWPCGVKQGAIGNVHSRKRVHHASCYKRYAHVLRWFPFIPLHIQRSHALSSNPRSGQRAVEIFPDVHRVIPRLKTWIRGTHSHVSRKHLNRHLAEFSYRFNRRFKQRCITIFDRLVTACCATQATTYRQLIAELSG